MFGLLPGWCGINAGLEVLGLVSGWKFLNYSFVLERVFTGKLEAIMSCLVYEFVAAIYNRSHVGLDFSLKNWMKRVCALGASPVPHGSCSSVALVACFPPARAPQRIPPHVVLRAGASLCLSGAGQRRSPKLQVPAAPGTVWSTSVWAKPGVWWNLSPLKEIFHRKKFSRHPKAPGPHPSPALERCIPRHIVELSSRSLLLWSPSPYFTQSCFLWLLV